MKKSKRRSFEIALAGISAALATVFILLSFYVKSLTISFYALSAVALMLPLLLNSLFGFFGSYIVTSIISVLAIGYIPAMPFVLFIGIHTLSVWFCQRWKKLAIISLPVKIGYTIGIFFALLKLMGLDLFSFGIFEKLGITPQWWYIILVVAVIFVGYDLIMQFCFKALNDALQRVLYKYGVQPNKTKRQESGNDNVAGDKSSLYENEKGELDDAPKNENSESGQNAEQESEESKDDKGDGDSFFD